MDQFYNERINRIWELASDKKILKAFVYDYFEYPIAEREVIRKEIYKRNIHEQLREIERQRELKELSKTKNAIKREKQFRNIKNTLKYSFISATSIISVCFGIYLIFIERIIQTFLSSFSATSKYIGDRAEDFVSSNWIILTYEDLDKGGMGIAATLFLGMLTLCGIAGLIAGPWAIITLIFSRKK